MHRPSTLAFLTSILAIAIAVVALPAQSTAWAKGGSVESPCKKLIGAVRYKKDAMGLAQMDGAAQGAFLSGEHWAKATDEQKQEFVALFHKMFAGIAFPRIRSSFENLETIIYDKPEVKTETARVGSTIVILHPMKKQEIVAAGPYSICRNPLYVFSFIGAFGVGALSGSLSVAFVFTLICWLVFRIVVAREEGYLTEAFGAPYQAYCARTPRFLPNPALWRDEAEVLIRPAFFVRTVRDGLVFLLALPLFEALERLQHLGWFDAILQLP